MTTCKVSKIKYKDSWHQQCDSTLLKFEKAYFCGYTNMNFIEN